MSLEDIRDGTLACDDGHEVQHHESDPVILPHQGFKLLRLGPFSSTRAFRELRDDQDSGDDTLACDDERIQAHKVILSACGPFFRNVLRRNLRQNPLIY